MGRSVSCLNRADLVIYFNGDFLLGLDEDGEYCQDIAELNWKDFHSNLQCEIKKKLKSYYDCDEWDGRETKIFLENELAQIGFSEYCGLCSLSVRAKEDEDYYSEYWKAGIAKHHVQQIEKSLVKCLENTGVEVLNRLGTMSNGVGVFEKANT